MMTDVFDNAYLSMLNATPSTLLPTPPEAEPVEETFDGVSKDLLNLQDIELKLNDINTALTNFEAKTNQWQQFMIANKSELAVDDESFKSYELDEKATLESINKIKGKILQINSEISVLKSALKQ